jgi:hypothetical protein
MDNNIEKCVFLIISKVSIMLSIKVILVLTLINEFTHIITANNENKTQGEFLL